MTHAPFHRHPLSQADVSQLERQIAEQAAVADIEGECARTGDADWLDTRAMLDEREHSPEVIDMARITLRYAAWRMLIEHSAHRPHLVRIVRRPS